MERESTAMANTTKPLTATEVKQAKPLDKVYNLYDGGGLCLRIKPNGSKLWLFNYQRPYTKARTSISLGAYPTVSLAKARAGADNARELVADNTDPKEHKLELELSHKKAHLDTLEAVGRKWLEIKKTKVTESYAEDIWRSLELHILPSMGALPIHKIKAPAIIEALAPVAAKGSLETVKRVCQRLNEIMAYAVNTGLLDANPLSGIRHAFQSPPKKHMPALQPTELPELMKALTIASIKITTRCLIEWQLHTMVRPSEAAGARWDEIDLENNFWYIPSERMKKKRPHSIPLSPQAMSLLELMRPISGEKDYIFPSDRIPSRHINEQTANMAIKRMGFGGRLVAHGLRSIASTTLNEHGFDPDVIEAALAHVDANQVRAAYNRAEYLERRRTMMTWWSNHIQQAATGDMGLATKTYPANVVAL
jgi:integrase